MKGIDFDDDKVIELEYRGHSVRPARTSIQEFCILAGIPAV